MKLLNKLSAAMLSVALMAGFTSCTETAEYDVPSTPKVDQVYFSNVDGATVALNFEQDSFAVKVCRVKAGGELIVPLNIVSDSANVFTYPDSVVFEADSTVAYIPVTFDFANIVADTDYPISFELLGDEVTPYGASKVNLVVKYAPWSQWKKFATAQNELTVYWGGVLSGIQVYQRESLLDPTKQQFAFENYPGYEMVIDYDKTTGLCHVGVTDINYSHDTYGAMYIADSEVYASEVNPGFLNKNEPQPSTFDAETGLFSLHLVYFVGAGYFGAGYEYLQLDGYTQPDYSITLEDRGHYVDLKGVDNAIIYMHKGADVDTYKYAIAAGSDLNALLGGILDGSVESTEVAESGYQLFPLTEAGEYSVVAVSFDKNGEAMDYGYLTFEFAPVGQSSPWESMGMATYREDLVSTYFKVENLVYEVEIEKNVETPGMYRLVNPYGAAYLYNEEGDYDDSKNYYMVINATDPAKVSIDLSYTGMDWGYGEFYVWSMAQYVMASGATEEDALPYWGKLENGVITFPGSALIIGMGEEYMGYANKNSKFAVALPGYEIPEDEAAEEGGEESAAPARRATKQINNDVETLDKISLKGRPANADVVAKYLQNTIY